MIGFGVSEVFEIPLAKGRELNMNFHWGDLHLVLFVAIQGRPFLQFILTKFTWQLGIRLKIVEKFSTKSDSILKLQSSIN